LLRPSDEPGIEYELKPNLDKLFKLARIRTNSAGLNDTEYAVQKPAGTYRVVVLGDSLTMASGVEREEAWHSVLEQRMADESPDLRYEFINFAVAGYHLGNYFAVLDRRAMRYSPDLVLIGFTAGNDHQVTPALRKFVPKAEKNGFFSSFLLTGIWDLLQEESLARRPLTEAQARSLERWLAAIKHRCDGAGVPVVLAYLSRTANVRLAGVQRLAEGLGIEVIDTAPAFRGIPFSDTRILPIDGHPNAFAHRRYADAIYEHLRKRLESARPRG
jgi:lysophospholipase L1-like esterase